MHCAMPAASGGGEDVWCFAHVDSKGKTGVAYSMNHRFGSSLPVLLVAALALGSGCASRPGPAVEEPAVGTREVSEAPAYRLRVGDTVRIRFLSASEMDYETPVTPSGTVTVAGGGEVVAAGKTVEELGAAIEQEVSGFLLDPSVSIVVTDLETQPVYVIGEVARPGSYTSVSTMTVLGALSRAGGVLPSGKPSSIMIVRTAGVEEPIALKVDISKALSGRDLSEDIELLPNDVVYAPRSVIGSVGRFVDLFFDKIAPAQLFYLRGYEMLHHTGSRFW